MGIISGDAAHKADEAEQRELAKSRSPFAFIYFVQAVDGGPIKIGRSYEPRRRFQSLQNSSPIKLRLCRTIRVPAAQVTSVEREFHLRFEHLRLHGEWFHPAPELARVAEAKAGNSLPEPPAAPSYDGLSVLADAVGRVK